MTDSQPNPGQSCALARYPWADDCIGCSNIFIICNWCDTKVCGSHCVRDIIKIPQLNACDKCIALNAYYVHEEMKIYVRKQHTFSEKYIRFVEKIYRPITKPCRSHD